MKKFRVILVMLLALALFVLGGCKNGDSTVSSTVFEQFENALIDKNLEYEKVTMAADLVGAEQGIKYKLQDENVEIYRFDPTSDAYLKAKETQSLQLDGFGAFEATVLNGYAINSDNLELINIFKDIVSK